MQYGSQTILVIYWMRGLRLGWYFGSLKFSIRKDYYRILEVTKDATPKEIKKAYVSLAKKHHPDLNKGKESDVFKQINEANRVLSNASTKSEYDTAVNSAAREESEKSKAKHSSSSKKDTGQKRAYESYNTYEYPRDFNEWFTGKKKERYGRAQERIINPSENNPNSFASESKYDQILKMHYEMGMHHSRAESEKASRNSPTLDEEIARVKAQSMSKLKGWWDKDKEKKG